jgi:S-adenosylhomocysteine hydrolase
MAKLNYKRKYESFIVRYKNYIRLPLLEYITSLFSQDLLKDTYLIACQHVLPSTHMMIRSMIDLGLDINKIAVIGKCYSTDVKVMENMNREGIYVCPSSSEFDMHQSFDQQFRKSIENFLQSQLERMQPPQNARIILLDDGGELLCAAQHLISHYPQLKGVEQTSSGYHKLFNFGSMNFPVMNVAQAKTKLVFESPLIAKSVVSKLEQKILSLGVEPKNILIYGGSIMGKSIRAALSHNYKAVSYDIIKERSEILYPNLKDFDTIIGVTGNEVINHRDYDDLKENVLLLSASSSDREFNAVEFRKLSGMKCGIHDDVKYNNMYLLNSGFPLNFCGGSHVSVPLLKIQLVCALLFLSVCECAGYSSIKGEFIELDHNVMLNILRGFNMLDNTNKAFYRQIIEYPSVRLEYAL